MPRCSRRSGGCSGRAESLLDHTRAVDHAIWVVAFLFYAGDAARLLSPRELLLVETGRGRWRPVIGDTPFASGGRVLVFGPLHLPYRGVFLAAWGRPWADTVALGAVIASLERLRASLAPIRGVASVGFVLLFVAGPVLTVTLGPDAAVVCVAAALYPTALAGSALLWRRRHRLGLTARRALWLSVEVLACPAFLPNLVRKITAHHAVEADGAQVLVATAGAEVRDEFLARLERRAEDQLEAAAPDAAAQASLRRYITDIRSTR